MSPKNHELTQRVACYIRVSTQEQKLHGLSLSAQREALVRYAEKHNLKIVEWYEDEGVSGRKLIRRRPALQRMLNDAQKGKFDRIIFIKLDRYFRSVAEYYECQKILDSHEVTWTATEEKYDLTTASGRYWVNQKLAMAEYEADNTGERIRLVNEYKIRSGQALTGAQNMGIAFTVKKDAEGIKRVVKDMQNENFVMDFINHFLTYQNKRQAYTYATQKHNIVTDYKAVSNLLKNPKLYGHFRGNDNYCEAYIDKATFDKIQEILSKNIKGAPSKNVYLFTGLLVCPICERKLSGTYNGAKPPVLSYRCNNHVANQRCTFNHRPNDKKIESLLLENLDQYVTEYIDHVEIEDARVKSMYASDQIEEVKEEMTRLNNMYRKKRIPEEEYDRDFEELERRLHALEKELEPLLERDLTIYEDLLKTGWKSLYDALNRESRRAFWRKYIKEIHFNEDGTFKRAIFF